jgi:nicotinamide-nucleotide amidase
VTGVAGPQAEGPGKPAGLVFVGLAERGAATHVRAFRFHGDRSEVRQRTVMTALQFLRFRLEGADPATPLSWDAEPES